jgi:hypothetical protein
MNANTFWTERIVKLDLLTTGSGILLRPPCPALVAFGSLPYLAIRGGAARLPVTKNSQLVTH